MNLLRALPLLLLLPMPAFSAGSISGNISPLEATFAVTLTITASCTLTTNDLAFGTHAGAIGADIPGQANIVVNCTNATPYTVGLNNGTGTGATAASRKMTHTNGTDTVIYSLYTTVGHGTVWDNNCGTPPSPSATCASGTGSGSDQTITVYGLVPTAGQNPVTVGNYSDTVTATLTF